MKTRRVVIVSLCILWGIGWSLNIIAAKSDPFVEQAQKRLAELGYDAGMADGKMGQKTIEAIKKFQQEQGLTVTGKLDEETITKLGLTPPQETKTSPTPTVQEVSTTDEDLSKLQGEWEWDDVNLRMYHLTITVSQKNPSIRVWDATKPTEELYSIKDISWKDGWLTFQSTRLDNQHWMKWKLQYSSVNTLSGTYVDKTDHTGSFQFKRVGTIAEDTSSTASQKDVRPTPKPGMGQAVGKVVFKESKGKIYLLTIENRRFVKVEPCVPDENGDWFFDNLPPGLYAASCINPSGFTIVIPDEDIKKITPDGITDFGVLECQHSF